MVPRDRTGRSSLRARGFVVQGGIGWTAAAASFGLAFLSGMPSRAVALTNPGAPYAAGERGYSHDAHLSERKPLAARGQPGRHSNKASGKEAAKPAAPKLVGPMTISVSIGAQHVTVYDDVTPIATAPISTGMPGHPTPMGIFSVIQKDRYHHSNIYSNAPMPFMQRITWSGVAMHAGVLPGFPASHGCIRLPPSFAIRLWNMTQLGERVIVARNDVIPHQISHPLLVALSAPRPDPDPPAAAPAAAPQPAAKPSDAKPPVGAQSGAGTTAELVKADPPAEAVGKPAPIAASLTAGSDADPVGPGSTAPLAALASAAPPASAIASAPPAHVEAVAAAAPAPVETPADLRPAISAFGPNESVPVPAAKPAKAVPHSGPISLFVSRKAGKLYVRKGFEPVFDVPIAIANKDAPLGTHVFTAGLAPDGVGLRWVAMSVAATERAPEPVKSKSHSAHEAKPAPAAAPEPSQRAAAEALNRIELPSEVLDRIAPYVTPGASLLISDLGLSGETGRDTDFIVTTR